jgi:DNA-binding response OmpR family regulator
MTQPRPAPGRVRVSTSSASVLVVSSDAGLRDQVAAWVDEAGYDVVMCPGPQQPGYDCIGLRGEMCPLDAVADLTVLDLHPAGLDLGDQTGRAALVELYQARGRPVLVLADERMSEPQLQTAGAAFLERTAERSEVLASVRDLLHSRPPYRADQKDLQGETPLH